MLVLFRGAHGSGGVAGVVQDENLRVSHVVVRSLQCLFQDVRSHQVLVFGVGGNPGDGFAEEVSLGCVRYPGGPGDDDLFTQALEGGVDEGLAPGAGDHLLRRHVQLVVSLVVLSDGQPEFRNPCRRQVASLLRILGQGFGNFGVNGEPGFPEGQVVDIFPGGPHFLDPVVDG